MCGIAGVKRMGRDSGPITQEQVESLLMSVQHRGMDATGIALMNDAGQLAYHKEDKPAWKFLRMESTERFLEDHLPTAMTVILHTRAWTIGSPIFMKNNHPLTVGLSAVVHNGVLHNHGELFSDMKLDRKAETDSDIIRAILDKHGFTKEAVRQLGRIRGTAAIAAISINHPNELLLVRSGNPLVVAMLEEENQLMWASTKEAIHKAARQWVEKYGMPFMCNRRDLKFNPMALESAWLINDEGVRWHDQVKIDGKYVQVDHRVHERYAEKQRRIQEDRNKATVDAIRLLKDETKEVAKELAAPKEAPKSGQAIVATGEPPRDSAPERGEGLVALPEMMKCSNRECPITITLTQAQRSRPMWATCCPACKTPLAKNPALEGMN